MSGGRRTCRQPVRTPFRLAAVISSLFLFVLLLAGCSQEPDVDVTAPRAVTDLRIGAVTQSSVQLVWSAVGDDGMNGRARSYDIRYSASVITE